MFGLGLATKIYRPSKTAQELAAAGASSVKHFLARACQRFRNQVPQSAKTSESTVVLTLARWMSKFVLRFVLAFHPYLV